MKKFCILVFTLITALAMTLVIAGPRMARADSLTWADLIKGTAVTVDEAGYYNMTLSMEDGNPGRVAYTEKVNVKTLEFTMDLTNTVTGTYPYWTILNISTRQNNFLYEDAASLNIVIEKHGYSGAQVMRVLLYNGGLGTELGNTDNFTLPLDNILTIKAVEADEKLTFKAIASDKEYTIGSIAVSEIGTTYFTAEDYDGNAYPTFECYAGQVTATSLRVSEFKDTTTVARLTPTVEPEPEQPAKPVATDGTQWQDMINGKNSEVKDGMYNFTLDLSSMPGRVAYQNKVDVKTLEFTMDLTNTVSGTYPYWAILNLSVNQNNFLYEDAASLNIVIEKHGYFGPQAARILLYNGKLDAELGNTDNFQLPADNLLTIKAVEADGKITFKAITSDAEYTIASIDSSSIGTTYFTAEGFDGTAYPTFEAYNGQVASISLSVSEFQDAATIKRLTPAVEPEPEQPAKPVATDGTQWQDMINGKNSEVKDGMYNFTLDLSSMPGRVAYQNKVDVKTLEFTMDLGGTVTGTYPYWAILNLSVNQNNFLYEDAASLNIVIEKHGYFGPQAARILLYNGKLDAELGNTDNFQLPADNLLTIKAVEADGKITFKAITSDAEYTIASIDSSSIGTTYFTAEGFDGTAYPTFEAYNGQVASISLSVSEFQDAATIKRFNPTEDPTDPTDPPVDPVDPPVDPVDPPVDPVDPEPAGLHEVEGGTSMTPWNQNVCTTTTLMSDGTYKINVTSGQFGARVGADYAVDFATFEMDFDLSKTYTGGGGSNCELFLGFAKGLNAYPTDDAGQLMVCFRKVGDDSVTIVLYRSWNGFAYNQILGQELNVDLTDTKVVAMRIEVTEANVIFHFNNESLVYDKTMFYGDARQVFNADGDNFDGTRYIIIGTMQPTMEVTISKARDALTKAYDESIKAYINAANAYIEAASALTKESSNEEILAAEALKAAIDASIVDRGYIVKEYGYYISKADAIVAPLRAARAQELLATDIANLEAAVEAIKDIATLDAAEAALKKVDQLALAKNEELQARYNTAALAIASKTDTVIDALIANLEAKVADLSTTAKLVEAYKASAAITSEILDKVSEDNQEAYKTRVSVARNYFTVAKTSENFSVPEDIYATKTENATLGVYVPTATPQPSVFLSKKVSALNASIEINFTQFTTGFFAIEFMENMETFIATGEPSDVANNKGIVIKISKANDAATAYDVSLYNIRATSANGFEGTLVTTFSAPIKDGKISVSLLADGEYVDLIVNGTKLINSRMKKTTIQGMFGKDLEAYLGIYTALGSFSTAYEYEVVAVNAKNPFDKNVEQPNIIDATGITLNRTEGTMAADGGLQLIATVTPSNATDNSVTWTSSDENIAVVDETGYVLGVADGVVTITATTANGISASCTIVVGSAGGEEPTEPSNEKTGFLAKLGCKSSMSLGIASIFFGIAACGVCLKKREENR